MRTSTAAVASFLVLSNTQKTNVVRAEELKSNLQRCATSDEAKSITNFFPDQAQPKHSKKFTITYHDTYKVITNKEANESYLLYQCGLDSPPDEAVNNADAYTVITQVPLPQGIALTSTVQIPMMELLGLRTDIQTYVGDDQYISSPCLKTMIDEGDKTEVLNLYGLDNDNSDETSLDGWATTNPERVLLNNGGFTNTSGTPLDQSIVESAYLEDDNKGKFEWIYMYAALYNLESLAKDVAEETFDTYDCVSNNAEFVSSNARPDEPKPVVIWAYYSNFPGVTGWNVATCNPKDNYYCEYATKCSADLLSVVDTEKVMDNITFASFASDADVFLYMSPDWNTVYAQQKDMLDTFKSVENRQVYDYQGSGENAWFEQRMAEPDVALEDFCTVVNMTRADVFPHKRKWFRNVFTEPVGELPPCNGDMDQPLQTQSQPCIRLDAIINDGGDSSTNGGEIARADDSGAASYEKDAGHYGVIAAASVATMSAMIASLF